MFIPTWLILIILLSIPCFWSNLFSGVKEMFGFAGKCIAFPFRVLGPAEGSRKEMHRLQKRTPSSFVGLGSPKPSIGIKWN